MGKGPLEGIKVADFTWVFVGPQTTKFLADCGAEVIRVESTKRPCLWRTAPPFKDGEFGLNRGGPFALFNTSKRSITLNLSQPKAIEVAKKLVAWADIVAENFAGGVMEKMGLGYEELRKIKPDIIMLSSCMQGQTGPHANHPGYGNQLSALAGFSHISGWPDRDPADIGYYTDFVAPLFNTTALLAALDYRRRTGKGQYLDLSQFECSSQFMSPLLLDYGVNNRVAGRNGNRSATASPHGVFPCVGEDRWCAIAVFTDQEWRSFCEVIGNPGLASDPRFATLAARKENEDELERLVGAWSSQRSAEEAMTLLQGAGVAAGVLETGEDLLENDPQFKHRRFFRELDHPEIGRYRAFSHSFQLSKSPYELESAPLIGEDNDYVCREVLGMSEDEINDLIVEEVLL